MAYTMDFNLPLDDELHVKDNPPRMSARLSRTGSVGAPAPVDDSLPPILPFIQGMINDKGELTAEGVLKLTTTVANLSKVVQSHSVRQDETTAELLQLKTQINNNSESITRKLDNFVAAQKSESQLGTEKLDGLLADLKSDIGAMKLAVNDLTARGAAPCTEPNIKIVPLSQHSAASAQINFAQDDITPVPKFSRKPIKIPDHTSVLAFVDSNGRKIMPFLNEISPNAFVATISVSNLYEVLDVIELVKSRSGATLQLDLVLVHVLSNDLTAKMTPDWVKQRIAEIHTKITDVHQPSNLVFFTPPPRLGENAALAVEVSAMMNATTQSNGFHIVNVVYDVDESGEPKRDILDTDGLHLAGTGIGCLAECMRATIAKFVPPRAANIKQSITRQAHDFRGQRRDGPGPNRGGGYNSRGHGEYRGNMYGGHNTNGSGNFRGGYYQNQRQGGYGGSRGGPPRQSFSRGFLHRGGFRPNEGSLESDEERMTRMLTKALSNLKN